MASEQTASTKALQLWFLPRSAETHECPPLPPLYAPFQFLAREQSFSGTPSNKQLSEDQEPQSHDKNIDDQSEYMKDLMNIKQEPVDLPQTCSTAIELSWREQAQSLLGKSNVGTFDTKVSASITSPMCVQQKNMCNVCGKVFRSRQQLNQHTLVHTDVRKYKCTYCSRAFKQPSHLHQHHRIHTGEKPYRCPVPGCCRAFPQLSNLNHHLRNHDKPAPPRENTCIYCDRVYASDAVLRNHMSKIHGWKGDDRPDRKSAKQTVKRSRSEACKQGPQSPLGIQASFPLNHESKPSLVTSTSMSGTIASPTSSSFLTPSTLIIAPPPLPPPLLPLHTSMPQADFNNIFSGRYSQTNMKERFSQFNRLAHTAALDSETNKCLAEAIISSASFMPNEISSNITSSTGHDTTFNSVRSAAECAPYASYSEVAATRTAVPNMVSDSERAENGQNISQKFKLPGSRAIYSNIPLVKIKQTMDTYKYQQQRNISTGCESADAQEDNRTGCDGTKVNPDERCPSVNVLVKAIESGKKLIGTKPTYSFEESSNTDLVHINGGVGDNGRYVSNQVASENFAIGVKTPYQIMDQFVNDKVTFLAPGVLQISNDNVDTRFTQMNEYLENSDSHKRIKTNLLSQQMKSMRDSHHNQLDARPRICTSQTTDQPNYRNSQSNAIEHRELAMQDNVSDEIFEAYNENVDSRNANYQYTLCNTDFDSMRFKQFSQPATANNPTANKDKCIGGNLPDTRDALDNVMDNPEANDTITPVATGSLQSCEQGTTVSPSKSRKRKSFQPQRVVPNHESQFNYLF